MKIIYRPDSHEPPSLLPLLNVGILIFFLYFFNKNEEYTILDWILFAIFFFIGIFLIFRFWTKIRNSGPKN